jgi:hypothetical protein
MVGDVLDHAPYLVRCCLDNCADRDGCHGVIVWTDCSFHAVGA